MGLMLQSYIVTMWHDRKCRSRSSAMKRNLKGSKITDSRPRNYGSFKFIKFVLKTAPNRGAKFGIARKMLYLCTRNMKLRVRVKAAAQHSSSELGSAFALHFTCSCVRTNKAVSGGPMQIVAKYLIPCKNTFKHYGKDFVWSKTEQEPV